MVFACSLHCPNSGSLISGSLCRRLQVYQLVLYSHSLGYLEGKQKFCSSKGKGNMHYLYTVTTLNWLAPQSSSNSLMEQSIMLIPCQWKNKILDQTDLQALFEQLSLSSCVILAFFVTTWLGSWWWSWNNIIYHDNKSFINICHIILSISENFTASLMTCNNDISYKWQ